MVKAAIIGYGGIGKYRRDREAVPGLEVIGGLCCGEEGSR